MPNLKSSLIGLTQGSIYWLVLSKPYSPQSRARALVRVHMRNLSSNPYWVLSMDPMDPPAPQLCPIEPKPSPGTAGGLGCELFYPQVPQKYNESRCIIFTILILLFETLLFTINIKTVYHQYILFYAVCIITGTYTSFFALFLPKLYIIIFKPERNTLQLQCHTPTPFGKTRTFDKGVNTSCSLEELQDKMEVTEMTGTSIDFTSERDV